MPIAEIRERLRSGNKWNDDFSAAILSNRVICSPGDFKVRSVHNFADRSAARPSLLMRYMSAIGGGVVVCRGGPNDIRYDGTSQEILRSKLDNYAFLPVPTNSQSTADDQKTISILNDWFQNKTAEIEDKANFVFYRKYNPIGVKLINEWALDIEAQKTPERYPAWIRSKYQLTKTTPLIFCASPEGLQGWPSWTADVRTKRPDHPTELFEILDDCGYAKRFRLVGYEADEKKRGVHDFQREQHWQVGTNFKDVGLIYLSRTSKGRTVLVIAGCSNSYATFAGVRICADHGRTELNHLVEQFINGKVDSVAVPFSCAPAIPGDSEDWITPGSPVHAVLHVDPVSNYSELAIRRLEDRLAKLQPRTNASQIEQSLLAKYFSEKSNQGLSVLAKSYPVDQRDDATSHDLLLSLLPNTRIYPVPASVPWNIEGEIGLPEKFQSELRIFITGCLIDTSTGGTESSPQAEETHSQSLARLDASSFKKLRDWKEIGDEKAKKTSFHKWVESQYYFPSSNLLIVGSPESHLGYVPPAEWADYKELELPQLAKLLQFIGYPNRFELKGSTGTLSKIFDRKSWTPLEHSVEKEVEYSADLGIIYLSRGPEGQIITIVGGNAWLGTLGGIQLLFAERRPSVDAAIQEFLDGKRKSVDIAYSCRRIEPSKRAREGNQEESTELSKFAISHPSIELDVNLIGEDQLHEYQWSSDAEELFRPLWKQIELSISSPKPLGDESISMTLNTTEDELKLVIKCDNRLRIDAKHVVFCSKPTVDTYKRLAADVREAHEEFEKSSKCCRKFMVVGPTGVGKEGAAIFSHNSLKASNGRLEQLNMAAFSEYLIGSDLFGHVAGSYTDAGNGRKGVFELCKDKGMVVLDEFLAGMESLQTTMQPMLLRVLEDAFVVRMGDEERAPIDLKVCVFATTNEYPTLKELEQAVADKRVRGDLIARFPNRYELLPISSRPLEILPSFLWTLNKFPNNGQAECNIPITTTFTVDALKLLLHFNYPENFRQLHHAATQIAKSADYRDTKIVTKELVLNALGNRTASATPTERKGESDKKITIKFSWKEFQDISLEKVDLKWKKKRGKEGLMTHTKVS